MKRLAIGAVLATAAISLSACGSSDVTSDGENPSPSPRDGSVTAFYDYGDAQTVKVVSVDGRTCYLYDGIRSGGIWCTP